MLDAAWETIELQHLEIIELKRRLDELIMQKDGEIRDLKDRLAGCENHLARAVIATTSGEHAA